MAHACKVCMRFCGNVLWFMRLIFNTMKILLHVDRVFCFGQMSFWLFEFRNIGKFGDYLVDNVLKIEKI